MFEKDETICNVDISWHIHKITVSFWLLGLLTQNRRIVWPYIYIYTYIYIHLYIRICMYIYIYMYMFFSQPGRLQTVKHFPWKTDAPLTIPWPSWRPSRTQSQRCWKARFDFPSIVSNGYRLEPQIHVIWKIWKELFNIYVYIQIMYVVFEWDCYAKKFSYVFLFYFCLNMALFTLCCTKNTRNSLCWYNLEPFAGHGCARHSEGSWWCHWSHAEKVRQWWNDWHL